VKTELPLRVRVYNYDECDLVLDRDLNAARTLAALVGEATGSTSAASCRPTPPLRGDGCLKTVNSRHSHFR
jgi:putative transposase